MSDWTPQAIDRFVKQISYKLDGPAQFLGDEPNSRRKDWDSASFRMLLAASWPYDQAAGNQSIPAVWKAINDRREDYLCDRYYLPATPRDLRTFERAGAPVFGVESRHQLRDFDVVGTSISYVVLLINFCNTGEAPIWMGDKSFKPISKVQAGDEVMGWEWRPGPDGKLRRWLTKTRVTRIVGRQAPVVQATMESGRVVRCTPDHKWLGTCDPEPGVDGWTHVAGQSTSYEYRRRGMPSNQRSNRHKGYEVGLGTLSSVVEPSPSLSPEQQREADWLAGLYDGEGTANGLAQCPKHNPEVCERIERAFEILGIDYGVSIVGGCCRQYRMRGGRQAWVNWLNWTRGAKRSWFDGRAGGTRLGRKSDRVMEVLPIGVDTVYSMETETGNYVAWGYASSNCKYLTMSGVPLRWRDRVPEEHPMIMVGGQAFCNPEVMAPIADCIFVGEAEDEPGNGGIGQVCRMIEMFKKEGTWNVDRVGCYARLARTFNYLYFPRFVSVAYGSVDDLGVLSKRVTGYSGDLDGMRMPFRKRHVIDLDKAAPLDDPPLLYTDPSLGSGDIEASRGCPAWCTFCRLSYAQKPFRQHGVDYMVDFAKRFQANIGGIELSPFGPDFPMQTNKNALLKALLENVSDHIDTVAQRIDDFIGDDTYLLLQAAGGARSITLGLEGVSQRMRDLVGKATSDAEVKEAVARGIRAGFRKFKLFMIIGLPGEDTGDVARIMQLARDLADIRDSLAADKVTIQFSFTPLLYEAQTPFQWFPTWPVPDHDLIDVANELKELKILFKIGVKGEPNKVHFFQLCQRASRGAGEAVIDVLEEMDQGCWGGVPKTMQVMLNAALKAHGFANGFGDLFGERGRGDMLGWEFIDTGISRDLLWGAFVKMREFAERTDSASYDKQFDERYHGNEWIDRCDERCVGNSCGVCSREDLALRRDYLADAGRDRAVNVSAIRPVDQSTIAVRVRARLHRPREFRSADNGFRRHLLRRAGYRTQADLGGPCVSKPAIWFASDAHGYRDWSYGTDYVDFGLTRRIRRLNGAEDAWMTKLRVELAPWLMLDDGDWEIYPANVSMRSASGASLHQLEVQDDPDRLRARLRDWEMSEFVPLLIRQEDSYFAAATEQVNALEYVDDLWVVQDGTRLVLKMLARHRAGPYQVYQALTGKSSWIEAARFPARTLDVFSRRDEYGAGHECLHCGRGIPESLLGALWDDDYCPRCQDEMAGTVLAGLYREVVT